MTIVKSSNCHNWEYMYSSGYKYEKWRSQIQDTKSSVSLVWWTENQCLAELEHIKRQRQLVWIRHHQFKSKHTKTQDMLVMLVFVFRDTMLISNNRSDTFDNYWRIIKTMNQRELFHPKNKYFHLIHLEKNTHNSSYKCSVGKHGAPNGIIWIQYLIQTCFFS